MHAKKINSDKTDSLEAKEPIKETWFYAQEIEKWNCDKQSDQGVWHENDLKVQRQDNITVVT